MKMNLLWSGLLLLGSTGLAITPASAQDAGPSLLIMDLADLAANAFASDGDAGKASHAQSPTCHSVGGANGVGPGLKGLGGRKSVLLSGLHESRTMGGAALTCDTRTLETFAGPSMVSPAAP